MNYKQVRYLSNFGILKLKKTIFNSKLKKKLIMEAVN